MARERVIFSQDKAVLDTMAPKRLSMDHGNQVNTVADSYTLRHRKAFFDFIRNSGDASSPRSETLRTP